MKNNTTSNVAFIDGQMVDLGSLSLKDLEELREKLKRREKEYLEKINGQLKDGEDLDI